MKQIILSFLLTIPLLCSSGYSNAEEPSVYRGTFFNSDMHIRLVMNLDAPVIPVPGMEDLDSCYGYIDGRINGAWFILEVEEKDDKSAIIHTVSERGADTQDIELQPTKDGMNLKLKSGNYLKAIKGRKYAKVPKPLIMVKL